RAGAEPARTDMLFFGSNAGDPLFDAMVSNFAGVMDGARDAIVETTAWTEAEIDEALAELDTWSKAPDAALWYVTCWAEGLVPGDADRPAAPTPRPTASEREALLGFLADSAQDLSSTLDLDEVFAKIAGRIDHLLDAHLVCIMLWNEERRLLEHSYSMKYGQHVPQTGGFPLGTGLSGSAAQERRAIRVANVELDPRYVRFRHAEVEIRSELAVPLLCDGRLVGVLDLESTELAAFTHEHEQVVVALASHIAAALENARLYRAVKTEERRLERDLATAREVQRGLLPRDLPTSSRLEIGAAYRPALELSGDFYDVQALDDDRWLVAVGDVAGKGSGAALLASVAVGLLRALMLERHAEPAELLEALNQRLRALDLDHRFVALALGVVDATTGHVSLANAGVAAPRVLRAARREVETLDLPGLPLGGLDGSRYRQVEIDLEPGDALVLLTDGIEDLGHERGTAFGQHDLGRSLIEAVDRAAADLAEDVLDAADRRAASPDGDPHQIDDRTILIVRVPS
ncbi:MAG: GAF domain-containing SpoIIE family protein phosphatase, partial [Acidobacteriota bacterium]